MTIIFTIAYLSLSLWFKHRVVFERDFFLSALLGTFLALLLSSVYEVIILYLQNKFEKYQVEKLRNIELQSRINLLTNQVEPHFLSNSLVFLQSLVKDNTQATSFIQSLSSLYYNLVALKDQTLIDLKKEVSLLDQYYQLMKFRFPDAISLNMDFEITDWQDKQIPPFSLQTVFENAIKHNAFSIENPLVCTIEITEDSIVCTNRKKPRQYLIKSTEKGLVSLNERFKLILNKPIWIHEDHEIFQVTLPLKPF